MSALNAPLYDNIGINYGQLRKADPRIAALIHHALGIAKTVINVGAGTGSYEPDDRQVTAVEPSLEMIRKRPVGAAPAVQAAAEGLPFADEQFDAGMAILTIHHWTDQQAGLAELRRVVRGPIVILTFDPAARPWLTDYIPELAEMDEKAMPAMEDYARWLGPVQTIKVPVPYDCVDGFLYAYWRRPEAYLDPRVRSGSSSFWKIGDAHAGWTRFADDLATGRWKEVYADIIARELYDAGYRLIVSEGER